VTEVNMQKNAKKRCELQKASGWIDHDLIKVLSFMSSIYNNKLE